MQTHVFIFAGQRLGINLAAKGNVGVFSDTFEKNIALIESRQTNIMLKKIATLNSNSFIP